MNEKIDETLRKITGATSKENSRNLSSTRQPSGLPGDPNCPICGGLGYYRFDLPVDYPDFGKLQICTCRNVDIQQQVGKRLFALSNLEKLNHLTFNNFMSRGRVGYLPRQAESLERALVASNQYSQSLTGWLLIQGGYGCGKTHLAAAISNFAVSMGVPTLFLTVPDLLDTLRFAYDNESTTFEERFEEIRSAALLVLDDFGTQNATEWAKEKLFQIINYRYINKLPLVITTNLSLKDLDGRIRSRLEDPELVGSIRINAPDYRNPAGDMGFHELSALQQKHKLTFDNFSLRKQEKLAPDEQERLEKVSKACLDFAREPRGWLVILGGYASGKTHLAASIANYLKDLGEPELFVSVPEFLDHLRATFNPNSQVTFDQRFDEVKTIPVLILDDLSTQQMTPWVREKLHQLFNYRYENELPTVITTSDTLENMDARIRSRLNDRRLSIIYALSVPPYTGGSRIMTPKSPSLRRKTQER
jgi:DNA replication protein DnaC